MAKNMYQKRKERQEKELTYDDKKTTINWYPGHMAKTKRLIQEQGALIDIIYEVLDARIPYSSKIEDIDSMLKNKPTLLILNKSDLCDLKETKKWQNYYESKGYQVVLTSNNEFNLKEIMSKTNLLMADINKKRLEKGMMKKRTRVLIAGIPNVGKSTIINRLVGKKATNVGNKPGVTKSLGWIRINSDVELLDSPGLLWPKIKDSETGLNLSALTAIREEIIPMNEVSLHILKKLEKYYPNILDTRYGIKEIQEDTFEIIGKKRGALVKGGFVDYDKVYSLIVNDIKDGNIRGITFDRYEK